MAEQGLYRQWMDRVHDIPRLRRFRQTGIGESYPMLAYTDSGLRVRLFYFDADLIGPDTLLIGPPRVLFTVAYDTIEILEMDPRPFDLPLFEDVAYTLNADERAARKTDVLHLEAVYDQILGLYRELPGRALVDEFAAVLQMVVPPVFWPYYALLLENGLYKIAEAGG